MIYESQANYQTLSVLVSVGHDVRGGQRGLIPPLVAVVWPLQRGWANGELEIWAATQAES